MALDILACGTINVDTIILGNIAGSGKITYLEKEPEDRIGGHPIDVAIDLVKLGVNCKKIGVVAAIGHGWRSNFIQDIIKSYNIEAFLQYIDSEQTKDSGQNHIFKQENEDRRFHIHPGANWFLNPEFVKEKIRETSPKIFCIRPGYVGIDLHLEEIFKEAKKQNAFVFLDIMQFHPKRSPTLLCDHNLFRFIDAVHCNEQEAIINTGKQTVDEAVQEILALGAKIIFLTKGENGAEIITDKKRISSTSYKIKTVDTTGCGDAFCAGVVYKMLEWKIYRDIHKLSKKKLKEILRYAQAVGASAATAAGCTEGISKKKVKEILGDKQ